MLDEDHLPQAFHRRQSADLSAWNNIVKLAAESAREVNIAMVANTSISPGFLQVAQRSA